MSIKIGWYLAFCTLSAPVIMEVLKTIGKVFAFNLRKFRADLTQAEVAEKASISLRAYNRMEAGQLPKSRKTLLAVARALGVEPETKLFMDPDLLRPATPQEALEVLREALGQKP